MEFITRRLIACLIMLAFSLAALPAKATEVYDDQIDQRPSALAMFGDAVLARPLLLAGTLGATAIFVAALPFTALGGTVKESADTLVVGIAKSTFTRCLGCTAAQDEWKNRSVDEAIKN